MGALRKKIEADLTQPNHIIIEAGVGYRFVT
jgi:DNA-binding response OmpR family regulator